MFRIEFPKYAFKFKKEGGKNYIYDLIRKKYVVVTPEEWVRQHMVHYLINQLHYPKNFIAVEKTIKVNQLNKRFDVVVYNIKHQPAMLIECKQPEVSLQQITLDQAGRYNTVLKAPYLLITNGENNICCHINFIDKGFSQLDGIPAYSEL